MARSIEGARVAVGWARGVTMGKIGKGMAAVGPVVTRGEGKGPFIDKVCGMKAMTALGKARIKGKEKPGTYYHKT